MMKLLVGVIVLALAGCCGDDVYYGNGADLAVGTEATCQRIRNQMEQVATGHDSCQQDSDCHWANKVLSSSTGAICTVFYNGDVLSQMQALEQQYEAAGCRDHCDFPPQHPCVNGRCMLSSNNPDGGF